MAASEFTAGVGLTDEQRIDWLRLIRSENVGPRTFRTLLNHCGGALKPARLYTRAEAEREIAAARRRGGTASCSSRSASRTTRRGFA